MRALRGIVCGSLVFLAGTLLSAAGDELRDLHAQLEAAEHDGSPDDAAVAEISRRIVKIDPTDHATWEKRVRALLGLGDLKGCQQALDQWEQPERGIPVVANELKAELDFARENYDGALDHWQAYLRAKPDDTKTLEMIAWVHELRGDWDKAEKTLTKLIGVEDSAGSRVWRARCRMQLRKWDAAIADINKANAIASDDEAVKEWLPQFETLEKSLPAIKALDRKIAGGKPQPDLLLDRAALLSDAGRHELALEDADAALKLSPGSRRAILQKAFELDQLKRDNEAAKLRVIVKSTSFTDGALKKIGELDARIVAKPKDASLLTERAREYSDIDQYALALEDAAAACDLDPKSAAAQVEAGFASMKLGNPDEAKRRFTLATELDPKNAVAWRSLGELRMAVADYPAAIDFFSRSLKLHESPLVLKNREKCYRFSGHEKEADQDLQRWQKLTAQKKK